MHYSYLLLWLFIVVTQTIMFIVSYLMFIESLVAIEYWHLLMMIVVIFTISYQDYCLQPAVVIYWTYILQPATNPSGMSGWTNVTSAGGVHSLHAGATSTAIATQPRRCGAWPCTMTPVPDEGSRTGSFHEKMRLKQYLKLVIWTQLTSLFHLNYFS